MPDTIRDGTGKGYLVHVNKKNELTARATTLLQHSRSVIDGNYFELTSNVVNLVDAAEKGIMYLRNNEASLLIIDRFFVSIWPSTGGDDNGGVLKYYKNPVVTGGTPITPVNTNFGEADVAGIDLKTLATIGSGTIFWTTRFEPGCSLVLPEERICIPPGYSFGVSIEAPAGNTYMDVSCNIAFYRFDLELL